MDDSLTTAPRRARCSRDHYAPAVFATLRFDGYMPVEADGDEPAYTLDCRTCECGGSFSKPLTAGELAAPFNAPPSAEDIIADQRLVPGIRWAFHEAGARWQGAHLVDVLHHVERDGVYVPAVSLIAAERDCGVWEFRAIDGAALDESSEILLDGELKRERAGRACFHRIDETDMQWERTRFLCERLEAARAA